MNEGRMKEEWGAPVRSYHDPDTVYDGK